VNRGGVQYVGNVLIRQAASGEGGVLKVILSGVVAYLKGSVHGRR